MENKIAPINQVKINSLDATTLYNITKLLIADNKKSNKFLSAI